MDTETEINQEHANQETIYDLQIKLKQEFYPKLAERVYKDIENMHLFDVFMNNYLKHHPVCVEIINVMRRKSYTDLQKLFLSEQKNVSELVTSNERFEKDIKDYEEYSIINLLVHKREIGREVKRLIYQERCNSYIYSVRVISWVIHFGHHGILRYIIDQIQQNCDDERDLFEKSDYNFSETVKGLQELEKFRLFLLACLSRDIETVNILLKYVEKDQINSFSSCLDIYRCPKYTPLSAACQAGNIDVVRKLLEHGADVNLQAAKIATPLVTACREGHIEVVSLLIEYGADLNLQDNESLIGHTPLTAACEGKHFSVVEKLLEAGANVNEHNIMYIYPLTLACKGDHIDMCLIDMLLSKGANVNPDVADFTPLICASRSGNLDLVKKLISKGADVNHKDMNIPQLPLGMRDGDLGVSDARSQRGIDDKQLLPITFACIGGHLNVVKELINNNSEIDSFDDFLYLVCRSEDIAYLQELDTDLNLISNNELPLFVACEKGHMKIILELLKAEERIDLQDTSDKLLTIACKYGYIDVVTKVLKAKNYSLSRNENAQVLKRSFNMCKNVFADILTEASTTGLFRIVQMVTDLGADVNWSYNDIMDPIPTPLVAACEGRYMRIVNYLLQRGADVNMQGGDNTPLSAACKGGFSEIVEILVENGANINLPDSTDTPMTAACKEGRTDVVKYLIEKNANVNLKGLFDTPLTAACKYGHVNIVLELLKAGAQVNLSGRLNTPLTAASYCGNGTIVKMLIKKEADVNKRGQFDLNMNCVGIAVYMDHVIRSSPAEYYTPLTAAIRQGHYRVVEELLKANVNVNLDDGHETPLSAACRHGHDRIAEKLLQKGADVNVVNCWGFTPLYEVLFCKNEERFKIFKKMIAQGVDYSIGADGFPPPIMFARIIHGKDIEDIIK